MVIYFSGTGNSRYAAEAIADRLGDETVCANDIIRKNETGRFKSERPWVFVFPIYLSSPAQIFADFIRNSEFKGNKKAYFIATCASAIGSAPNICSEICGAKGLEYMGTARVQMPQNYIALFKMTESSECERRISAALETADKISKTVSEEKVLEAKFASGIEYAATKWVEKLYNGHFTSAKKFFAADSCTGCGVCVKACPLNNVSLNDGKPKWSDKCVHCMACINRCPQKAIEYGKKTAGKKRYVCERYKPENRK